MDEFVIFLVLESGDKEEIARRNTLLEAELYIGNAPEAVYSLEHHTRLGSEVLY